MSPVHAADYKGVGVQVNFYVWTPRPSTAVLWSPHLTCTWCVDASSLPGATAAALPSGMMLLSNTVFSVPPHTYVYCCLGSTADKQRELQPGV